MKAKPVCTRRAFHPCSCTAYNGGQCYNCLNGAHSICDARRKCGKRNARRPGLMLVFKS